MVTVAVGMPDIPVATCRPVSVPQIVDVAGLIADQGLEVFIFQSALLLLGHLLEAGEDGVELVGVEIVAQLAETGADGIAAGVLAEDDAGPGLRFAPHQTDRSRAS